MSRKRFTPSKRYSDIEYALSQKLDSISRSAIGAAITHAENCLSASSAKSIASERLEAIRLHSQQLANAIKDACEDAAFEVTFWTCARLSEFPADIQPLKEARDMTRQLTTILRICESAADHLGPKAELRRGGQNKDHLALMSAILAHDFKRVMLWSDKPTRVQGAKIRKAAIAFHRNLPEHLKASSDHEFGSKVRAACVSPNFGMPEAWLHLLT